MPTIIGGPIAVSDEERTLSTLINLTRASVGLPPLSVSASLSDIARCHAERMASDTFPFARNPDLWKHLPSGWVLAGENIACRSSGTVADLHQQWVNSPEHCANMLRGFDNVGIGYAVSETGNVYAVQVFGLYLEPLDPVPEPRVPAVIEVSPEKATAPRPQ